MYYYEKIVGFRDVRYFVTRRMRECDTTCCDGHICMRMTKKKLAFSTLSFPPKKNFVLGRKDGEKTEKRKICNRKHHNCNTYN